MNSFLDNRNTAPRTGSAVLTAPKPESSFKPLFVAKGAEQPAQQAASDKEPGDGSQIELVQTNGRVERIIVTCSCCNRIELECKYQA